MTIPRIPKAGELKPSQANGLPAAGRACATNVVAMLTVVVNCFPEALTDVGENEQVAFVGSFAQEKLTTPESPFWGSTVTSALVDWPLSMVMDPGDTDTVMSGGSTSCGGVACTVTVARCRVAR